MNVEPQESRIDKAHAKIFARTIYRDIAAYIQSHQQEYQMYLQMERMKEVKHEEVKTTLGRTRTNRKTK